MTFVPKTVKNNPWIQTLTLIVAVGLVIGFAYWIRDILLPFFLAFIIAYILDPLVDWFELKFSLGRTFATIVVLILISLLLISFFYYLTNQTVELAGEIGKLAENPPELESWVKSVIPEFLQNDFEHYLNNLNTEQLFEQLLVYFQKHLSSIVDTLTQGSTYVWLLASQTFGAVGFLINVSIVLIVAIYLLRDFDIMISKTRTFIPPHYRDEVDQIFRDIDDLMRAYFRGHLIVCVTIGILYGLGYQLVGLNGGLMVGFLSGLMNVIPYLGPAIGFSAAFLMGIYQFGISPWVLAIVAVYVIVQSFEGNFLTPKIVGGAVGLNPVIVIFALMVFGKLMGFLGLLLAIPLSCIIKVVLERLMDQYRESSLYNSSTPS